MPRLEVLERPRVPPGMGLRVVGDVHGDARAFAAAAATDLFVLQLGDLIDNGPDSAASLRIMFELIDQGRGLFLLGNHDLKLARALSGRVVRAEEPLARTLDQWMATCAPARCTRSRARRRG